LGDQDGSHADEHLKDEIGRFGDEVFRTLDQVTPVKKSKATSSNKGDIQLLVKIPVMPPFLSHVTTKRLKSVPFTKNSSRALKVQDLMIMKLRSCGKMLAQSDTFWRDLFNSKKWLSNKNCNFYKRYVTSLSLQMILSTLIALFGSTLQTACHPF
jgi:hypothetical protein